MEIGRKIYFEKLTGNTILDTGERQGSVIETTQEQDFTAYVSLSERIPSTVGVISLPYGQDSGMFGHFGYHVDVVTRLIVWDLTPIQQEEAIRQVTLEERLTDVEITQVEIIDTLAIITGVPL